jgi:glycosyltransferase involved in cell wall biosynthesis
MSENFEVAGQPQLSLTVIVLTFNEVRHIQRCLDSISVLASRIVIIDSNSSDRTQAIAVKMGADLFCNPFVNQAIQFNWGLDHCDIRTDWVMRLDADEIVTPELARQLQLQLSTASESTVGLTINRQIHFMGRWIKHGSIYPIRMLRVWRNGKGRCENRWMDEHIIVDGDIKHIDADIADINLNNITWWINKHNHYASREAVDLLMSEFSANTSGESERVMSPQAKLKRWLKHSVYARLPLGFRALVYFLYRCFIRLGFLDGWQGLAFHFLQGFWYRFLVDVKVYELRKLMAERKQSLAQVVKDEFGYDINS